MLGGIGVRRVDSGESKSHCSLARIGRITGIVGTVLSVLAIVAFIVVAAALDATEDSLDGSVDRIREEIEGIEVPSTPDVSFPDVSPSRDGGEPGVDSGGLDAPD